MMSLLQRAAMLFVFCVAFSGIAAAQTLQGFGNATPPPNDPSVDLSFPAAGDAYFSATNGSGTIPAGGQTTWMWTSGDYVISPIFTGTGLTSATDISVSNWTFADDLIGDSETVYALVNGIPVAQFTADDCNGCGTNFTVSGGVTFSPIAPVNGGYQIELELQNTLPDGGGSIAFLDGGQMALSGTATPEPGSLMLLGLGLVGLTGLVRKQRVA